MQAEGSGIWGLRIGASLLVHGECEEEYSNMPSVAKLVRQNVLPSLPQHLQIQVCKYHLPSGLQSTEHTRLEVQGMKPSQRIGAVNGSC